MKSSLVHAFLIRHRMPIVVTTYLALYAVCFYVAYLLRFDFLLPQRAWSSLVQALPVVLLARVVACVVTREWWRRIRYTTLSDVVSIAGGALAVALLLLVLNPFMFDDAMIPRSVIAIDFVLVVLATGSVRLSFRMYVESYWPRINGKRKKRTMIFGCEESSISILRSIHASLVDYQIVAFVAEGTGTSRSLAAGIPVVSEQRGLARIARKVNATHVLIPSSLSGRRVRELITKCREAGLKAHVIPGLEEIVDGRLKLTIRDVTISDLLRRDPIRLDQDGILSYVHGRRVLVTGGAGSIGSEICRQVLGMDPELLVVLDHSECGVFTLQQELIDSVCAATVNYRVADVKDKKALALILDEYKPELIFHAAAYKHVPLMETAPQEAIRNNVLGTRNLVDLADQHGVDRFVLISTDKAVRPTSIMGATKLVAEKYLQSVATTSATRYMTVRFGNVLNSAGSVVPTFRKQIESGGPVTVTHQDMCRYFMTIPEAVQLVLQAGAIGESGDIMILDMGEPVRIVDLARDMIDLSGLRCPEDIDIVFTGLRPGEKLYEELFYPSEEGARKIHEKIFRAPRAAVNAELIRRDIAELSAASERDALTARNTLKQIVAAYVDADQADSVPFRRAA